MRLVRRHPKGSAGHRVRGRPAYEVPAAAVIRSVRWYPWGVFWEAHTPDAGFRQPRALETVRGEADNVTP